MKYDVELSIGCIVERSKRKYCLITRTQLDFIPIKGMGFRFDIEFEDGGADFWEFEVVEVIYDYKSRCFIVSLWNDFTLYRHYFLAIKKQYNFDFDWVYQDKKHRKD